MLHQHTTASARVPMKWGSSWPPTLTLLCHEMVKENGIIMATNNKDFKDDYANWMAFAYTYLYYLKNGIVEYFHSVLS